MSQLDQQEFLTRNDPTGMHRLFADFADQAKRALEIAEQQKFPRLDFKPTAVVVTGLGGSAAGGDLLAGLCADQGSTPAFVNRDYAMPAFVNECTLVFAASYSGNTEETLSAYEDAKSRGATIIGVGSGGQLAERCHRDGHVHIEVPGGQPPRTALGYMFVPLVVACQALGLIPKQDFIGAFDALREVKAENGYDVPESRNPAKQLASVLHGAFPVLYGASDWTFSVAQRWRGQINENAKSMAMTHVYPELCHNEILGWEGSGTQGVARWETVLLSGGDESERIRTRIGITEKLIGQVTRFHHVEAKGQSTLARILSLAHFGDWLSLYLAALAERDPGQMVAIDRLKEELAKIN